ncbi:MAG: MATE family efflux transporter [Spirochaetaceae bacterium]|jgi:putative MATE family efflux protein|nr:MATE family efflux transporter [Spirochaetaceae bacterium]
MAKITQKPDAATRLGTESVVRLLLRFSVPAILGMLVNALYNVVDRIFVGRGVNETALGGLALVMPLMTISFAFAMLFGIGSANMISVRLGQGKRGEAVRALNMGFFLLFFAGLVIMCVELVGIDFFLSLLGAQDGSVSIQYARRYYRIILYGHVFQMIGFGMSHCTRAQGFPLMTMTSMLIGAGMNMILDPVFIFVFGWGVEGAAWATIISQLASAIFIVTFARSKKAVVRLDFRGFRPSLSVALQIMTFGSAPCLLQFAMSAVQLIFNWSMSRYGAATLGVANGGDIALSGMNIIQSLAMLILMPVFGINQGAQPILGYNYGAKNFARVRHAYLLAILGATLICVTGWVAAFGFPRLLVRLFAPAGSAALLDFTPRALRLSLLMTPINGFQVVSANFFTVTGRPKISSFLALLRQVILLIPCMVLFGNLWGLYGCAAAMPTADFIACAVTGAMILRELGRLKRAMGGAL